MQRTPTGYRHQQIEVDIAGGLTPRGAQALAIAANGSSRAEVAKQLGIKKADPLFNDIFYKLNAKNMVNAIYIAVTKGYMRYLCAICLVLFGYFQTDLPIRTQTARIRIGSRHIRGTRNKRREHNINDLIA